jgi:hypothetical protein
MGLFSKPPNAHDIAHQENKVRSVKREYEYLKGSGSRHEIYVKNELERETEKLGKMGRGER